MTSGRLELVGAALRGTAGIEVAGELDMSTARELGEALDAAILDSAGPFVVDLSRLRFLDSSGVNALLRARALLGRAERSLIVVCPPGSVRRVFEIVGIDDLFELHATRAEAARALDQSG